MRTSTRRCPTRGSSITAFGSSASGTSGVQFIGYTIAVLSILGSAKVAVALLVLGVPIIDTFWIIVGRLSRGGSPFAPDRSHIHHRLLDLGLTHRDTVLVIYGICVALGVLALLVSELTQLYAFLGVFVVSGLILFAPTRGAFGRPEELEEQTAAFPVGLCGLRQQLAHGWVGKQLV